MNKGSVIVIDDDDGVLDSLVSLLTIEGYRATGFSSASAFLEEAALLSPVCLITDIRMPQVDGLSLLGRLKNVGLGTVPTIVVSGHADVPIAVAAMQLGAVTVLEKPFPPGRLLEVVARAIESTAAVAAPPEVVAIRARYDTLSPREREVLAHLLNGSSSKVTAIALGLSPRTIDVFRANILRKMEAPNLAAVATQASRAGVGTP